MDVTAEVTALREACASVFACEDSKVQASIAALSAAQNAADRAIERAYRESKEAGRAALKAIRGLEAGIALSVALGRLRWLRDPDGVEREERAKTRQLAKKQLTDTDPAVRENAHETLAWLRSA